MTIAEPSVQSLFLVAMCNGHDLGTGTGFIVTHDAKPYLISNYHVVAGRNPQSGQPRHISGAVPDTIRIVQLLPLAAGRISWEPRDEPVLDEHYDRALWIEHPTLGRTADVVALPLMNYEGIELHPYDLSGATPEISVGPSDGVSIIGFPFGRTAGGAFAIWTRGFVASEPDVDFDDLPCFLVDARTRPGQSGSPVIAYHNGGMVPLADGSVAMYGGPISNLLGVYSGRINEESDLGVAWKVSVIKEILNNGRPGHNGVSGP